MKPGRNTPSCLIVAPLPLFRTCWRATSISISVRQIVRAGGITAYAMTGEMRSAMAPEIPTFDEMGWPTVGFSAWQGLFAPSGTPTEVISKLNTAVVEALADPAVRTRLAGLGADIFPREQQTPEALSALQKAGAKQWWPIIKELGIKAE